MSYIDDDEHPAVAALARVTTRLDGLRDTLEHYEIEWGNTVGGLRSRYSTSERVLRWLVDAICEQHDQLIDEVYANDDHPLAEHMEDLESYRVQDYEVETALRTLSQAFTPLIRLIGQQAAAAERAYQRILGEPEPCCDEVDQ